MPDDIDLELVTPPLLNNGPDIQAALTAPLGDFIGPELRRRAQESAADGVSRAQNVSLVGMGMSILGGLLKGMAQFQAGQVNAQTDRHNAAISDFAAGDAILRGQIAAATIRLRGSQVQAQQKAAYSGNGVDVRSGSVLDVLNGTGAISDLDALTAASNAAREAWGYRTQAQGFRRRATIDETTARNEAGESILGGAIGAAKIAAPMIRFADG